MHAVITGGTGGIGRACVEAFAKAGWQVSFTWHQNAAGAEALKADLIDSGFRVAACACDVTSLSSVEEAFAALRAVNGPIDALVSNAGVAQIRMFQDTDEPDWDAMLQVDLLGVFRCVKAALPDMLARHRGSIVNIASMWGEVGASCESVYAAAKGGVIAFSKSLAKELGPAGIRVNCVSPGVIDTAMNSGLDAEAMSALREETPLGRIGTPADVAAAALFLAGDGAGFITGQVLGVSGGMVI